MIHPLGIYSMDNVDCDICGNTGNIAWVDENGVLKSKECECMAKRRSIKRIKNSGMEDMMSRYTFDNYLEVDKVRKLIKMRAMDYINAEKCWMYVCGRSGSGKTHICTAVCKTFIDNGVEVYYMNWRDESVILKASVNDSETYDAKMKKLKTVEVLYIDDFLKAGSTAADVKLAFEILNARYNSRLRTVISSEITLEGLFEIDEAIAGRIYELSARPRFLITAPDENFRKKQFEERVKDGKEARS